MPSMNVLRKPALNGLIVLFLSLTLILTPEASQTRAAGATPQSLIQVTTSADELNNDGDCSLREAIRAANLDVAVDACPAGSGADRINLPAGMYLLSIPGQDENAALTGDLDITADLTIVGEGKERTFVDANQIDRVFHVTGPYAVQFSSLTIQNGVTTTALYGGGGVLNESGGILTIANVDLLNNTSSETGGALDNAGIAEFGYGVQLTAGEHLMAELHVAEFVRPLVPSGKTGAHEQFPVEAVRDMLVQLFLSYRRVGGEIDHRLLAALGNAECLVGVHHQQLGHQEAYGGFPGNDFPHPVLWRQRDDIE